jgi:membrane protein
MPVITQMNPTIRHRLQIFERLREKMPVSRSRTRVHAWRDRILAKPAPALLVATGRALARDDATLVAAGVAFYALLSLFPLVLGLLSLLSFVLSSDAAQQQLLRFFLAYLPGAEPLLSDIADTHITVRGSAGLVSVLSCFWTASALFGGINRAFRRAWQVRSNRDYVLEKLRHIIMALTVGVLFAVSLALSTALEFLSQRDAIDVKFLQALENHTLNALARLVPFAITGLIFALLYKFVPDAQTRWRHIWPGVLLAAVLFEVAKACFVLYLSEYADFARVYGALGSVIALLVWVYVCAFILIVGAEFASEYGQMRVRQACPGTSGSAASSEIDPPTRRSQQSSGT